MRKLLVAISVSILPWTATVSAQRTVVSPPKPKVVATPTPEPKRSMMGRIFGRREATPTPAPVVKPVATPTPRPRPRSKRQTTASQPAAEKPATKPAPAATETPETQPPAAPKTEANPNAATPEPKPAAEEKPAASAKKGSKKPTPSKIDTTGMDDAAKFRVAKAAAQEDAAIKELQAKAEGALSEPEAHAASVAYNRALFRKVRELEPTIDGYVDKMEDAMLKRLNSEKKRE